MAVDQTLFESIHTRIGTQRTHQLGEVTGVLIRRYARAIGETDPIHYDTAYARRQGYADVVAPANLVTAVSVWDEGPPTEDLREDGTPAAALEDLAPDGVRVMGGGEDMEFHRPITAGTTVEERSTMTDVELRAGRSGPVIVVSYRHEFTDAAGRLLVTTTRKLLLR
ncbi:MaoC family dehydratase N-terminal domain-containing protein [Nocardioides sp. LHD-245]|uniref:FAS1-like dehydratase domain-containing protein n=1 Tax=Nocardioides sp. LHD-245 TaxID=3051387 RepID=UPI0027E10F6A|nr:MaoC family dehydratase N-terminal domain-containing protein [Nocardioides sp. LHD-245]